jgi:uncharacterized repeat protein (TIGR01451 family)
MTTVLGLVALTVGAHGPALAQATDEPDLSVSVEAAATTLTAGSAASFTVTVTNIGTADAQNVRIDEALPTGFDLASSTATVPARYDPAAGWTLDDELPSGYSVALTLNGVVTGAATPVVAVATAHATGEVNLVNNTEIAEIDVVPAAGPPDIALDVDAPDVVHPGQTVELAYSLTNISDRGIDAATVTIPTPGALELLTADASEMTTFADDLWSITGLGPNSTASLRITVRVAAGDGTQIAGTAHAECGCPEEDTQNNHADYRLVVEESIDPAADLVLVVTPDDTTPAAGTTVSATYTVTNSGNAVAPRPVVSTAIPVGATLVGATVNPGGRVDPTAAEWDLGTDLAPGETVELTLTMRIVTRSGQQLTQTSFVTCACDERALENNVSQYTLHIGPSMDAVDRIDRPAADETRPRLTLRAMGPASVRRGRWVTYRIVVTNPASRALTGVRVRSLLPGSVGRARTSRTLRLTRDRAVWRLGVLQPGERRTLDVRVRIDARGNTFRLLSAEVTGDEIPTTRHRRNIRILPQR